LKKIGLEINAKSYYNLRRKEQSRSLSPYEEALYLLRELEAQEVHVAVKEKYVVDGEGNKTDRIIECIAWWNAEQIQMARRFVSGLLAQTDGTFNTNEKRLLLQCFVGVDNTGKTFQFLQAFSTAESGDIIKYLLDLLKDHFFYDCPGFVVLMGDFGSGLSAGFALKAAEDTKDATIARERELVKKGKQIQYETGLGELQIDNYPLPTASTRPNYEPDSQTIIVDSDWPRAIQPTVLGVNQIAVTLQYCTWHAVEAIKRKLIHSGYKRERRDKIVDLIWEWIEVPTLEGLETARNKLILALNHDEKEYLTGWYQPKEPQFCKAYTCQYLNLGSYATQRIEKNHHIVSKHLHKNLRVSEAVLRICRAIDSLATDYEQRLASSRTTNPRLYDRAFFALVARRITLYCLELCGRELVKAKELSDTIDAGETDNIFDPEVGCQEGCSFPLQYRLPCRHWMYYFYSKNEPIPINLFHPRWLIDGPSVLHTHWQIRLDNRDYSKDEPTKARDVGDRSAGAGERLILDTALEIVERHKNLPPGEKEPFALAFKKMCDSLVSQHDEKLVRLQQLPRRLPDAILQPKLKYLPGRKRGLTGAEMAEQQEADTARKRRKALRIAEIQAQNDAQHDQYEAEVSQRQYEVAEEYLSNNVIWLSSDKNLDLESLDLESSENEHLSTTAVEPANPSENKERGVDSGSEEFLNIDDLITIHSQQKQHQKSASLVPIAPSSSRPARARKPTAKQASQNRRDIEKQGKRKAKTKRVDTTQLQEYELPFHSSQ